jgi:hypothetical protein
MGLMKRMMIDQDEQSRLLEETRILQKVNAAHRDAFSQKFPGQIDHCLRLILERLQAGLDKRDGVVVADTSTWRMSTIELAELAQAAYHLNNIKSTIK